MMQFLFALIISLWLANGVYTKPVRSMPYAARSVLGRVKSSTDPFSVKDYFLNYLAAARQHQQPQYGMAEYEPPYVTYLNNRQQFSPEALATMMPYMSQLNNRDYSYDYTTSPESGTDDQSWYEEPDTNSFGTGDERSSQDAALLQLFLDHLEGKYSLEDLETLEREAVIEDNTENQLQALMAKKKAMEPVSNYVSSSNIQMIPFRQGQKEEVIALPATNNRRPIFTRSTLKQEKTKKSPSLKSSPKDLKKKSDAKVPNTKAVLESKAETVEHREPNAMEPMVKTAYDSLRRYLDRERMIRQSVDEQELGNTKQKRFISDPKSLTKQLSSLRKTVS